MQRQVPGRLVQLAGFDNPRAGSFIPTLLSILGAARDAGWEVEMAFDAPAGEPHAWVSEFEAAEIPLRFAPPGNRRELGRWLRGVLAESDAPTILHTHFTTFDMPAVLAARGNPAAAVVWHQHMDLSTRPAIMVRNAIKFGGFGRLTRRILCPAPDTAAAVRSVGGPADRVVFLPNGIDADRFPIASADERARAREALGISADARVLLHFGWDWERKGGDSFMRALGMLLPEAAEGVVGLTITEHQAASQLFEELDLGGQLMIQGLQEDVQQLFAAADVFVAPSRAEGGTPYALLEALASGLPVVASDIAGHRYIGDAVPDCRIAAADPAALAAAITAVLEQGVPLPGSEAQRIRSLVAARFGLAGFSQRLLEIYGEVLP